MMRPDRPNRARARRAFTLLEVMLALILASIVVGAAMSVLSLVLAAQRTHADDVGAVVDRAQAQQFFRDAFVRLVAGVPLVEAPPVPVATDQADENDEDDTDAPSGFDAIVEQLAAGGIAGTLLADEDTDFDIMFEMYLDTAVQGWPVPVLECVLTDPPTLEGDSFAGVERTVLDELGFVRSLIRLVPNVNGLYDLMFEPIDPYGLPIPIVRDLEWASFYALPGRDAVEWTEVHAAYLDEDFPAAIRVVLFYPNGDEIDWLFEVQSLVPADPS